MPFKSFIVPVFHGEWAERELNQFLKTHRALHVEQRWVDQGWNSFWAVWVDYVDTSAPVADGQQPAAAGSKKKVDYKDRLSTEDFDVYLQLRNLRKEMAAEEGVALYAVFTNEQLAQVVERRALTKPALQEIAGVGEARAEKYGPRVFELLNEVWKGAHEASGKAAGKDR
jgi:superfamily II DNA helicase RecQ